jgi:hypothetical protein
MNFWERPDWPLRTGSQRSTTQIGLCKLTIRNSRKDPASCSVISGLSWRSTVWVSHLFVWCSPLDLCQSIAHDWATAAPRGRRWAPANALIMSWFREFGGVAGGLASYAAATDAQSRLLVNRIADIQNSELRSYGNGDAVAQNRPHQCAPNLGRC